MVKRNVPNPVGAVACPGPFNAEIKGHEVRTLLETISNLLIIDIRREDEFAEGYIEGAMHMNKFGETFEADLAALDRTKPYLMYCARGNRSVSVFALMKELEFQEVYHLVDGFNGCKKKNGIVVATHR